MSMNEELLHVGETGSVLIEGLVDRATGSREVGATASAIITNPTGGAVTPQAPTYHEGSHKYEIRFVPLVPGTHHVAVDVVATDGAKYRARGGVVVYAWP